MTCQMTVARGALVSVLAALVLAAVPSLAAADASVTTAGEVAVLTPETYEATVTDPSKDVLVAYTASWCGHCKALKPVFDDLAKTYAEEPDVVVSIVDADAHKAIGNKEDVKGYPTIKFFPRGADSSATVYEAGRDLESFVTYINKAAGTDVLPSGQVLPQAGVVESLRDGVSTFLAAAATERDTLKVAFEERLASLDARARKHGQYYLKVMDRVKAKGDAWLTTEKARLSGLLESAKPGVMTEAQMRNMRRRLNVIDYFIKALGQDVSDAAGDAADAAVGAAEPVADTAADIAAKAGGMAAQAGKAAAQAAADTLEAMNPEKEL